MIVIPAIDLKAGRCVRLLHGKFDQVTDYSADATGIAAGYARIGCPWLHVVDLDGAETGERTNLNTVSEIISHTSISVQIGGGIRSEKAIDSYLRLGAKRVVIGSRAIDDVISVRRWLESYGTEAIVLALDVRLDNAGIPMVTTHGWTKDTSVTLDEAIEKYLEYGLKHVLCTDVSRDGAMQGPNTALYRSVTERFPGLAVQASGGVSSANDLHELKGTGVSSAITGKALLEKRISDKELEPFLPAE